MIGRAGGARVATVAVEGDEFAQQHRHRPAVDDDVVGREDEAVTVLAEVDEGEPDQWSVAEPEAPRPVSGRLSGDGLVEVGGGRWLRSLSRQGAVPAAV
ncbi:hypothetical protein NKH18_40060 [Streptomyces sp. M10(2022)]